MSLPASNRFAVVLSALAVMGTAPAALAQQGYAAPSYGYALPGQLPPGYAMPAPQAPAAMPAPVAPPFGAPVPGYAMPGMPVPGFDPYGGFGSQWATFAPSEPNYAPYERPGANQTVEQEVPTVSTTVAETVPMTETAPVAASDYSYEVTPATGSATYIGNSAQISSGTDPYAMVPQQTTPGPQTEPTYQVVSPSFTQEYDAAAVASVPQQAPAAQGSVNIGGYEFETVPAANYVDLGAQTTVAAAPAPVMAAPAFTAPSVMPSGTHFVQVGSFIDPNRANNLVGQLASGGVQAFIVPAQVRGKLYHRVRIGAASKRDAELVLDQVRALNHYEARIVRG